MKNSLTSFLKIFAILCSWLSIHSATATVLPKADGNIDEQIQFSLNHRAAIYNCMREKKDNGYHPNPSFVKSLSAAVGIHVVTWPWRREFKYPACTLALYNEKGYAPGNQNFLKRDDVIILANCRPAPGQGEGRLFVPILDKDCNISGLVALAEVEFGCGSGGMDIDTPVPLQYPIEEK